MKFNQIATALILSSILTSPMTGFGQHRETAQEAHDRAVREQTAKDHRHHTGAKIVGGSAAGGAVAGALLGGGKGAVIGAAVGAGGGAIANKVRKDKAVDKRERRDERRDDYR